MPARIFFNNITQLIFFYLDVEILENRYPVMIGRFSLRQNSGGVGEFTGGNGLTREIVFREDLNLCVLTERRVFAPYGLDGGDCGQKGRNTLVTRDGRCINLGSKSEVKVQAGVRYITLESIKRDGRIYSFF